LGVVNKQAIGDIYMRKREEETALRSNITSFGFEAGVRSQYLLCGMPATTTTTSIRFLSCWKMSDKRLHGDIEGRQRHFIAPHKATAVF
jgi:hypothetical protein